MSVLIMRSRTSHRTCRECSLQAFPTPPGRSWNISGFVRLIFWIFVVIPNTKNLNSKSTGQRRSGHRLMVGKKALPHIEKIGPICRHSPWTRPLIFLHNSVGHGPNVLARTAARCGPQRLSCRRSDRRSTNSGLVAFVLSCERKER